MRNEEEENKGGKPIVINNNNNSYYISLHVNDQKRLMDYWLINLFKFKFKWILTSTSYFHKYLILLHKN